MNFSKRKSFKGYRRYKFFKKSCLNKSIYIKVGQDIQNIKFLLVFFGALVARII